MRRSTTLCTKIIDVFANRPHASSVPETTIFHAQDTGETFVSIAGAWMRSSVVESTDVYVNPAGDDAAPGTAAQPVRTVTHALTLFAPNHTRHAVLHLAAGTFTEPGDIRVNPPTPLGPFAEPFTIVGEMADVGLGTLTVTGFALNGSPTPQGAGDALSVAETLVIDAHAGAEIRMSTGSAIGYAYQNMTNQPHVFYLPHDSHDALPAIGDTFSVKKPASIISINGGVGQIHFCSGIVSMYGVAIQSLITDIWPSAEVCASSISFLGTGSVLVQGKLSPGLAQFVSTIPTAPSNNTPSALGFYSAKSVNVAYGGILGRTFVALTGGFPGVGCIVIRNGTLSSTGLFNISLYTADVPRVSMSGPGYFVVSQHWRVNGSFSHGISGSLGAQMIVSQVDVSGCAGDGIRLDGAKLAFGSMLVGSGNAGVGLRTLHGGRAIVSDPQDVSSIVGNQGAVVVGSHAVVTWQQIKDGLEANTTDSKTLCYVGV